MRLTLLKETNIPGEDLEIPDLVNSGPGGSTVCSERGLTLTKCQKGNSRHILRKQTVAGCHYLSGIVSVLILKTEAKNKIRCVIFTREF